MHHSTPFVYLHFLFFSALALPTTDTLPTNIIHRRCGTVGQFYNPTPADWQKYNVDVWLSSWIIIHQSDISKNTAGFAGAFGQWTLGNPDWSCRDEGSTSNCDTDTVCDNRVLNDKGKDIRPAYYVLEGVSHLHTYFMNLGASLEVSAIAAALSKDSWALTFYNDKDVQSTTALKEILNAVGTIIGIGAAFAGLAGPIEGAVAGAGAALYGGAVGAATPLIGQHADDTFQKSADLGLILGSIVVGSLKAISLTNNKLMHGDQYQGNDIKDYLRKGAFVKNVAKEKSLVIDMMSNFMVANAINLLWRQQKVFIMGGGACGDKQGIGEGPQSYSVCRDGKAWYLYYWKENGGGVDLTSHQWGRVEHPPGADQLGQGDWSGVKVSDVINSSLDSYNVAGYSYDSNTAATRAKSALTDGWRNPGDQGPSWEGTFTIPVCDVGSAISSSYFDKAYILQDYGMESRPVWCGPVCNGDLIKTKQFINAANMQGFKSPKHLCPQDPGY